MKYLAPVLLPALAACQYVSSDTAAASSSASSQIVAPIACYIIASKVGFVEVCDVLD